MDEETLFRVLFIAIFIVFAVIRIPYRVKSAGSTPEKRVRNKKWVELLMAVGILGYFFTSILYILFISVPFIFSWTILDTRVLSPQVTVMKESIHR